MSRGVVIFETGEPKEEALRWLEHAFEQRTQLGDLNRGAYFWLQPLHSDPRFQDLLRRLRLPA